MIKNFCFYIFLFFTIFTSGYSESTSTSITNISSYKLKNEDTLHNSNNVSANLKLMKLSTTISSDRNIIRVGEMTGLKVSLTNFYELPANNLEVFVFLPKGFKYIENSAFIENNHIVKIEEKNRGIYFHLEKGLDKDEKLELFFSAKVDITAKKGTNAFSTFSQGNITTGGTIFSNTNTTEVFLDQEENKRRGVIFGLVFVDLNGNKICDSGEPTVPNVKVFLENGHFAITDGSGRYSIFGERALTHVVRLDELSAPKNSRLIQLDNRYSKDGTSAFADVKRNELYKVNFAFSNKDEAFLKEIKDRHKLSSELPSEIEDVIENEELTFASIVAGDTIEIDGYFSDGMTYLSTAIEEFEKEKHKELLEKYLKEKKKDKPPKENLEESLKVLDNNLDFLNLKNNQIVPGVISIKFKSDLNSKTTLYLNDKAIPETFLGTSGQSPENNLAFYQYDGIKLKKERNTLKIQSVSPNKTETKKINVIYPSDISKIDFLYNKKELTSDFTKPIKFKVLLKNSSDFAIKTPYFISVENSNGTWIAPEDISNDPGLQFIIENGEHILEFIPPAEPGEIDFKINIENLKKEFKLNFKSPSRPLIASGIIEGRVDLDKNSVDFFQDTLSGREYGENNDFSYRTAIFATGNLKDDYNLTLSYDNSKNDDDVFFQKVKRDDYYLVFGDDSIKGYEAQSRSHLYLLLENENTSYLYGDYTLDWSSDELDIGSYSRTLTGYKFNYDNSIFALEAFLSDTKDVQVIEELPGRDISGPYYLKNNSIIDNSEQISIVVYDKHNPAIPIIEVEAPNYTLDYHTGILYFNNIIPEFDKSGNPLFIRVNYEVEDSSGEKHAVYGAKTSYKINEYVTVGGTYIRDEHPQEDYKNKSINMVIDGDSLGKITFETGETTDKNVSGKATLIKYINNDNEKLKSKVIFYDSDEGFSASNSFVESNARLFSINNTFKIDSSNEVAIEGFNYKDKTENKDLTEMTASYKKNLTDSSSLEVGGKYSSSELQESGEELVTAGVRYDWSFKDIPEMTNYIEYEQDINNSSDKRLSVASEYKYSENVKFYGKYDLFNTIEDTYIINRYNNSYSKLAGVEFGSLDLIKPYIEYREHSNDERNKELAYGLQSDYKVNDYLSTSTIFERVEGIEPRHENEKTNLIFSYLFKDGKNNISTSSIDLTEENNIISLLFKGNYGRKINNDFTFAIKNRFFSEDIKKNVVRNRLLSGIAYRDLDDVYNSLYKYEMVYDDQLENKAYTHFSHIINTTHNVQPNEKNIFTFNIGGKYVTEKNNFASDSYFAYVLGLNWKYFLTNKIDIGINTSTAFDEDYNNLYGLGFELGYKTTDFLWLSLGYNLMGFEDKDFYDDDQFRKGAYLRFRILLHENMFNRFQ